MRLFKTENIPAPPFCLCWDLFPKDKKIALEIGAGTGMFSLNFSMSHPDWFLLSVERTAVKAARFQELKKQFPRYRDHLYFIRADGVNVLTHLIPTHSLDKIFLLYPNPYPKAKQANLRWHNMSFFRELLTRLKPQGEIELRTNLKWYAKEFEEQMNDVFHLRTLSSLSLKPDHLPETAFEKKYLARGENCFQMIFKFTDN